MDKTLSDAILVANNDGITDRELASVVEAATVARRDAAAQPGLVAVRHPSLPEVSFRVPPDAVEVYERSGWTVLGEDPSRAELDAAADLSEPDDDLPKGNASRDEWWAYALGHGMTEDDVEPLTRDEIRAYFP